MAITNGYITREMLKAEVAEGSTTIDNERLDRVCYQASRIIDDWTGRRFYPRVETRYFSPRYSDVLWVDDLLSVSTLKTDTDGDRTYETTWLTTDYDLEPYNADDKSQPYTSIRLTPQSLRYFPLVRRGVEIAGTWGYFEITQESGSLLNGAIGTTSATAITVDDEDDFEVGHILKVDSEYMRVDAVGSATAANTLTVTRGVNGSTAATHIDDSVVYVLVFPNITESCLRLATRIWHLRRAPMGIATAGVQSWTGETAGTRWIQADNDLENWLAPYRRGRML